MEWQALKELNARGIYTPQQVEEQINTYWAKVNPDDSTFVNKDQAKSICEMGVNALGGLGKKIEFSEDKFNSAYRVLDPMGMGKNTKTSVLAMLTSMVKPDDDSKAA